MIHARVRTGSGETRQEEEVEAIGSALRESGAIAWVDLEAPSPAEVQSIGDILSWSPLTIEDLNKQGQRAKLEAFKGYSLLVMHDLIFNREKQSLETPEVDFVVGSNYVVTLHRHHMPTVVEAREFSERLDSLLAAGADHLLYNVTDVLVDGYFPALDDLNDSVEDLEQAIILNPTTALLPRILEMKRQGAALRRVISPQVEVFARLGSPSYGVVSEDESIYFRDVHDHLIRVMEAIDTYRDLMGGALDAYLSNVSNRMNEVMKRLTVLAALFLPITFFTGLLGMNLRVVPLWKDNLFWVFAAGMIVASAMQWLYFKQKGWM